MHTGETGDEVGRIIPKRLTFILREIRKKQRNMNTCGTVVKRDTI